MPTNTLIADSSPVLVAIVPQIGPTGQHSAALSDGRIVVTWQDTTGLNGDGSGSAIKAKVLNPNGSTAIDEFLVNMTVQGDQTLPAVAALKNGQFVITWTDASNAGSSQEGLDTRAQVFSAGGLRQGNEVLVNTTTSDDLTGSQVAGLTNGNFVVGWNSKQLQAGSVAVFSANGASVVGKTALPPTFISFGQSPKFLDLAADPNGGFGVLSPSDPTLSSRSYDFFKFNESGAISSRGSSGYSDYLINANLINVYRGTISKPDFILGQFGNSIISFLQNINDGQYGNPSYYYSANYKGSLQKIVGFINQSSDSTNVVLSVNDKISALAIESLQLNDFVLAYVNNNILHVGSVISGVYTEATYGTPFTPASVTELDISVTSGGRVFVSWTNLAGSIEGKFFNYDGSLAVRQDGTAGDDLLDGTAGTDLLIGLQGNDLLLGQGGDDYLLGGDGNDILNGGPGADTVEGGAGDDQYLVDNAGDVVTEAASAGNDTVWVGGNGWTVSANIEVTRLYGAGTQVTGSAGADVLVANAGAASSIGAGDGNDEIWGGGAFAHTLNGGAGDDVIRGQDSPAVMIGGTGNDQFVVGNVGVTIVENLGEGIDTAWVGVDGWMNSANVEIARLAAPGAVTLFGSNTNEDLVANQGAASRIDGNGGSDTLWGSPYADTLSGGAGDDIIRGQGGADVMAGGAGNDQYVVFDRNATVIENANEGYDIVYFAGAGSLSIGDNVEEARLVAGGTGLVGNAMANLLVGNSSGFASTLDGGAGNDIIFGSVGADRFIGGSGDDTMYSQGGADVFSYRAAGWGYDRIGGWTAGACKLQFEATSGVTGFSQLALSTAGGNTQVDYAGSTIVVFGALLGQTDFLFV
jgi:Ca2+-binding RTX toxin-like protein